MPSSPAFSPCHPSPPVLPPWPSFQSQRSLSQMVTKQEPLYMCVAWTERCPARIPQTRGGTLAPQSSRLPLFPRSPPAQLREQEVASGSCEAPLDQAPLHTGHQGQQNSPTKRTSRSDFTGLLLRVFSAGHSLSWLQAQTLDELLSCKTPQRAQSRAKRSSGRARFVFPVQPPRRHICCLFWRARTGSCCSVPIINLLKAPEVTQRDHRTHCTGSLVQFCSGKALL